ncbi:long-chain fatty acid--CoA ligase [Streptomyces sp. ST2-7A]|uniref:AMP-dependent synthetase/ligase n=1 Tax=Streptomyces sp. ST2-7A TaxID=2907214 RepID=UPI001F218DA9|nr:AMP-dependent synthetase/ligase [Streptomyces sp. ST2-7A]MCE7083305.1 AMP-dependent synthetase/ligase [Streptomyces sp. ST2-7A]
MSQSPASRESGGPALREVPDGNGLPGLIDANAARHPHEAVVARKREDGAWEDVTASAFRAEVRAVAKGLIASGVRPGDRVALMSRTRYEWTLLDFALWYTGAVPVPIYETSSAEQTAWILADSGATGVVTENAGHRALVESVRDRLPDLRRHWTLEPAAGQGTGATGDTPEPPAVEALVRAGEGVEDAVLDHALETVGPDTPATIIYTSGTTGRPKGCVLTHGAFLADARGVVQVLEPLFRTGESSVLLFLPLAHVFARLVQVVAVIAPIRLGHAPDVKTLTDELASFRPTIVLGVPRVFEKVYNSARAKAREAGKGRIFDAAAATAIAHSRARETARRPGPGLRLRHALFDRLVYRKLRAVLGGRATHAISGGAALGDRLGHFYRGIGFTVLEGYGLTETCAPTAVNPLDAPRIGTVGRPLPGTSVRIAEDGEVLLRGPHLFRGYWNNDAATAEAMVDGWYRTGDLGELDADGYLRLTGRKKEILVTAGGKNVAPAVIEDRIRAHALVAECIVVGDRRPFVAALITVDEEFLPRWAAEQGLGELSEAELLAHPTLRAELQGAVDQGNAAVSRAESVRRFHVLEHRFSEESGHLTPSMKLKRHVVARDFADEIEALYRS